MLTARKKMSVPPKWIYRFSANPVRILAGPCVDINDGCYCLASQTANTELRKKIKTEN